MEIHPVDPADDALLERVVGLFAATDAVDCPWQHGLTVRSLRVLITRGWDAQPSRYFAATDHDRVLAAGFMSVPTLENLDSAWYGAAVRPECRRQGIGTRMYDHLDGLATDAGRTVLGTFGWDSEASRAFAARRGYERRSVDVARRVDVTAMPTPQLDAVTDEAALKSPGYELVRVSGPLPDDLLDADLRAANAINDAPLDDLTWEDEVFDAQRVRHYERTQEERGMRLHRVLARHRETGEVAGHTVVAVEADRPWLGEQHDTTVVEAHRGHRLGLLLKADMMRWLRDTEPELRWVNTQNAESNDHMIAVNERLGYEVVGRLLVYQRVVSSHGAGAPTGAA